MKKGGKMKKSLVFILFVTFSLTLFCQNISLGKNQKIISDEENHLLTEAKTPANSTRDILYPPYSLFVNSMGYAEWQAPPSNLGMLFFDDFEDGVANWENINNGDPEDGSWMLYDEQYPNNYDLPETSSGNIMAADSDQSHPIDSELMLAEPLDLSDLDTAYLAFDTDFKVIGENDMGFVDISTNGSSWTNLLTYSEHDVTAKHEFIDISDFTGESQVWIRFHSVQPGWGWWWAIDNVAILSPEIRTNTKRVNLRNFQGTYNVYLNDELVAADIEAQNYQFSDLDYGQFYVVGISANYEGGESETVKYEFECKHLSPSNLQAEIVQYNNVHLTWDAPTGQGEWMAWDSGMNNDGIGLTEAGTFYVASHWDPSDLTPYDGLNITKIQFFPRTEMDATYVLKVWTGANAGTEVLSQNIDSYTALEWNEIELDTPVTIDASQELWFGYETTHDTGDYPAGTDEGPAIAGYGDMISMDGTTWEALSGYGMDYNWNLQAWVTGNGREVMPLPKLAKREVETAPTLPLDTFAQGNLGSVAESRNERALIGFNVYKNGNLIAEIEDSGITEYDDEDLAGGTYSYEVTAVYDDGESEPTDPAEAEIFINGPQNVASAIGNAWNTVVTTWEAPVEGDDGGGGDEELYELVQHSNTPDNAYYQNYDFGYGVVYDLSGYSNVTVEMLDFRHSSWGIYGTWDYKIHIVDWDTYEELEVIEGLQTTGDDQWEEEIDLGSVSESGLVGIFMEPMGNASDDAYPCMDADNVLDGMSYFGDLSDYSAFEASGVGDFLMDLWIMGEETRGLVRAKRFRPNSTNSGQARVQTRQELPEFITMNQEASRLERDLTGYEIYRDGNSIDTVPAGTNFYADQGLEEGTYVYGVKAIYSDEYYSELVEGEPIDVVSTEDTDTPSFETKLSSNYPNPFNPSTTINFSVKAETHVSIEIYNLRGQKVKTLVDREYKAGQHTKVWNGKDDNSKDVTSGIYFYKMRSGRYTSTKKMILLK